MIKNWLLKPSILKSKQPSRLYFDIVFAENDIDPIITDSWQKNEYGTVQFALIESIGKIKINQSVENEFLKL
jgi:3-dehydroquinate synthase